MKKFIAFQIGSISLISAQGEDYFGTSLEECERFAAKFYNTCDTTQGRVSNVAAMAGEETTCSRTGSHCVDSGYRLETEDCTWTRKLCVTCDYDISNGVTISV